MMNQLKRKKRAEDEIIASTEIEIPIMTSTASTELLVSDKASSNSMKNTINMEQQQEPTSRLLSFSTSPPYEFGSREDYLNFGVPLYEASITGDWETAKLIIDKNPEIIRFRLSNGGNTTLHVATTEETKQTLEFVKNLVNMMTREELEIRNDRSNTAFWIASSYGHLEIAKIMLEKNPGLLYIRGNEEFLPLSISVVNGRYNTVKYLYEKSNKMTVDYWTEADRNFALYHCVECQFFGGGDDHAEAPVLDVADQIVEDCPQLVADGYILGILARKPDAFNRAERKLIKRIIDQICRVFGVKVQPAVEEDSDAVKLLKILWRHASRVVFHNAIADSHFWSVTIFVAAEMGNAMFIAEFLRTYPDLIYNRNEDEHTIFHIAVMHRHQHIYNLLYEMGSMKDDVFVFLDNMGNNMLHLVGLTSKKMRSRTSGASLLMQRELLWYKEIEKMMRPSLREEKNKDGQTPYELFFKENEDLVSAGLDWMKDCMVVATLIVTVAFAVAFTVPGGYNQDTGIPIFIHGTSFLVLVIADAISLVSSSTSLLVFLSVLTARHGQRDFLNSLPKKLMIGLVALFISVAAMMVTFSASFFVLYHKGLKWVPILIAAFAAMPVIIFAVLQYPLLIDMFRSMYDSRYIFNPKKRMIYNKKSRL